MKLSTFFKIILGLSLITLSCDNQDGTLLNPVREIIPDLEYVPIGTFSNLSVQVPIGKNDKNGILELDDGSFLFVGTSVDTNIYMIHIGKDGTVNESDKIELSDYPKGMAHDVVKGFLEDEYIIVGNTVDGDDLFIIKTNLEGTDTKIKYFKQFYNDGNPPYYGPSNIEELIGYDIVPTSDMGYAVTGYLRQDVGTKRIHAFKVDDTDGELRVSWLRTYLGNVPTIGYSIKELNNEDLIISGSWKGNLLLQRANGATGEGQWDKEFFDSKSGTINNVLIDDNGNMITVGTEQGSMSTDIFVSEVDLGSIEEKSGLFGTEDNGKNEYGYLITKTHKPNEFVVLGRHHSGKLNLFKIIQNEGDKFRKCPVESDPLEYCFDKNDYPTAFYEVPSDVFQLEHPDHFNGYLICTITSQNQEDYFLRLIKTDAVGEYE